jgi:hypothetical protein
MNAPCTPCRLQLKNKMEELVEVYRQQERGPSGSGSRPDAQQAAAAHAAGAAAQQQQATKGGLFARMRGSSSVGRKDG